jgi:2'-5' RNA ligase
LTPTPPAELAAGIDYFFAVRPDGHARVEIANVATRFRRSQRASGVPVSVDNLHLALCPMGRPERPQLSPERAMLAAGAAVRGNAFTITLDAAMRCIPTGGQFPFVLCADPVTAAAALELRKAIAAAQRAQGLQVNGVSIFHPHVALQHGPAIDAIEESIKPIRWRAEEFVLIRSFFGQASHEVIGRWPLASEPAPAAVDMLAELANMPDLPALPDE